MSPYPVQLTSEFFPARLAMLPYVLDSYVTKLLPTCLRSHLYFIFLPIVSCNLVSIIMIIIILLLYLKALDIEESVYTN